MQQQQSESTAQLRGTNTSTKTTGIHISVFRYANCHIRSVNFTKPIRIWNFFLAAAPRGLRDGRACLEAALGNDIMMLCYI